MEKLKQKFSVITLVSLAVGPAQAAPGPTITTSLLPVVLGILGLLILVPRPKLKKIPVVILADREGQIDWYLDKKGIK